MNPATESNGLLPDATRADIQGFVTSGYAHLAHTAYLFLHITERRGFGNWLKERARDITTAARWRPAPGEPKQPPAWSLNIAFTHEGLVATGLHKDGLATFPVEFREGMATANRAAILGDTGASEPRRWEFGGEGQQPIHALLLLFTPTAEELRRRSTELGESLRVGGIATILATEIGAIPAHGKEHFGFLDGIGQPGIRGIERDGVRPGEFLLGHENEYGFFTPGPVVSAGADPQHHLADSANPHRAGQRDLGLNGTFVVYRKLEQDVAAFWNFLRAESERRLGAPDPRFMVWLAAKMVGRWPSGAPLALAPERDNPALCKEDNYHYAKDDPEGIACPVGSHARRTNPRDHLLPFRAEESLHMTARHRILRRGKPFGQDLFDLTVLDRPDDPELLRAILDLKPDNRQRGLHFLCVNASIRSQFEFIQQSWSNNPQFNGLHRTRDPITGNNGDPDSPGCMHVPLRTGSLRTCPLPRFVTTRAGAYLFLPSLRAVRFLAAVAAG